ncbi:MAG: dihydroneopterin aldolase [Chloroflexota bacterium]
MDKIIIKDLKVQGIIGIYDHERITPQEMLINIILSTDIREAAKHDDITLCVDYEKISLKVKALAEQAGRLTVEALAEDIASLCLETPGVQKVNIRVEKTTAITFTASVGVEIEREK